MRMKNLLLMLLMLPLCVFAQNKKIYVDGSTNDPYITHVIQPKENFYSIGRIYNISPRVYAPYNGLTLESGLSIGQSVKIPLNEINYSKDGSAAEDEVIVPLYRRDNSLFGYLKVKKELSELAAGASAPKSIASANPPATPPVTPTPSQPEQPVVKETPKEPVKETPKEVVKEAPKEQVKETPVVAVSGEGYFKNAYQKQKNSNQKIRSKGKSFKSTSGWNDKKYYCFHNRATQGSIVAIVNPDNGKTIYAKVLDRVPDIADNVGFDVVISDAAVEALGFKSKTFDIELSY